MLDKWSYSRINLYEQCPAKLKYKVIDRLADPAGAAADRGTLFHKVAEDYVGGRILTLPPYKPGDPPLSAFTHKFNELKTHRPKLEHQVAFDREWNQVDFKSPEAWGRMIYDVQYYDSPNVTVRTIDYKTGKPSKSHESQLDLYSATGLLLYTEAKLAISEAWYLDQPHLRPLRRTMTPVASKHVLNGWKARAEKMEAETEFKPTPGEYCRWCTFANTKGGPCSFG
jgi:RecB family exonuclease